MLFRSKRGLKGKIPVVFTSELPLKQNTVLNKDGITRKEQMPPATVIFTPAAAGILCASIVVRKILE